MGRAAREYRGPQTRRCCAFGVGVGVRDLALLKNLKLHHYSCKSERALGRKSRDDGPKKKESARKRI